MAKTRSIVLRSMEVNVIGQKSFGVFASGFLGMGLITEYFHNFGTACVSIKRQL